MRFSIDFSIEFLLSLSYLLLSNDFVRILQPKRADMYGSHKYKGEMHAGGWSCYCCCPCAYIRSNRLLFTKVNKVPGGLCKYCSLKTYDFLLKNPIVHSKKDDICRSMILYIL